MKLSVHLVILFVLLILTALPAAAKPELGSSPYAAQPLSSGLNVGTLEPGESFWYAFDAADLSTEPVSTVILNMVYKPGGYEVSAYVNFQVFTPEQVDRWLQGYTDQFIGMGVFTTTDFDQETAERLWSCSVQGSETYYVHLFNNSRQVVEYHLTALGQMEVSAVQSASPVRPISDVTPARSVEINLESGTTLEETQWLLVAAAVQGMSTEDAASWLMMANHVGWIPTGATGLSALGADSAAASDTYMGESGVSPTQIVGVGSVETTREETEASPRPSPPSLLERYPSVYPSAPLALQDGVNVGKLAPGGEHWYSFIREDWDAEWLEFMPITLFTTPADGNNSHHINFQIFTANQLQMWERGTPEDMVPMGAGQWVSRDKDPITGERIWAGHVIDGDIYYLRIFNNSPRLVDYYLITNDVTNTELGDRVWAANPAPLRTLWQPTGYIRTRRGNTLE